MMKFFRKYTTAMLAVFMSLLLVVWLGGTALTNMVSRRNDTGDTPVARAFGREVKEADLARIQNNTAIGQRLVPYWNAPWSNLVAMLTGRDPRMVARMREPLTLDEWYALDTEARENGVQVPAEQVAQYRSNIPTEYLTAVRDQQKLSLDEIDSVIRSYLRVVEFAVQGASAINVSEADVRDFIRQTSEKVKASFVVVDPSKLEDPKYQPTAEEIKAQFEKYKDKAPGGPGQFGYQLPEATKLEYIEVETDALANYQVISEDEAHSYWEQHKAEFKRPASQPAASAPATRPAEPKPYDYFSEAKPFVIKKLQHDKAVKAANRLAEELIRKLQEPWAAQPTTQPDGYHQPPASAMAPDLYSAIIKSQTAKLQNVLAFGQTWLLTSEGIAKTPLGKTSAFADSPQRVPFDKVAFMVAGLSADKKADPAHARLFRNVYETCSEPVTDAAGNVYIFRNVAVRPAQAPASVDEVKDKVVKDLRHIKAYAEAERIARDLAVRAKGKDLKTAFESDAPLAAKLGNAFSEPKPFARKMMFSFGGMPQVWDSQIPGVGQDPELVKLCFDLAGRATTTQPEPVAVHEDKTRQRWIVVEYEKLLPVTRDEYNKQREQTRTMLLARKRLEFIMTWFSHDQIMARAGWKNIEPAQKSKPAPETEKKPAQQAGL